MRPKCGCIILFRPCLSLVNSSSDDAGRFVLCEFRFQGKLFRVVSLYAPNRNPARDQFLDQVSSWVDQAVPTLICGDFNMVFDHSLERTPPGRVLPFFLVCLMTAVSLISGDIYIPPPQVTLGCIRTALSSLVSTSLVVRMCGSPPSCRVKLFCVPSLTIVLSFSVSLYWMLFPGSRVVETKHLYPGGVGLCPPN